MKPQTQTATLLTAIPTYDTCILIWVIFLVGIATSPKDGSLSFTLSSVPFTSLTVRYSQITQFFCAVEGTERVVK